jgi:hypothetical protein
MTTEMDVDALSARVTKQGSLVRQLKKDGASSDAVAEALAKLQELKISVEEARKATDSGGDAFDRKAFDDLILRKMFVVPAFEIHGGVKGLYDLGPPGCALKVRFRSLCTCDAERLGFFCQMRTTFIVGHLQSLTRQWEPKSSYCFISYDRSKICHPLICNYGEIVAY